MGGTTRYDPHMGAHVARDRANRGAEVTADLPKQVHYILLHY